MKSIKPMELFDFNQKFSESEGFSSPAILDSFTQLNSKEKHKVSGFLKKLDCTFSTALEMKALSSSNPQFTSHSNTNVMENILTVEHRYFSNMASLHSASFSSPFQKNTECQKQL